MGTREGVEKLPYGVDHSPSTKKQDDLIASIVKKYPVSSEYPEYFEYQQKKEKASATEFIDAFVERNSDRIGNFKKLVSYVAERPSVEKLGGMGCLVRRYSRFFLDQSNIFLHSDLLAEQLTAPLFALFVNMVALHLDRCSRILDGFLNCFFI